MSSGEKHENSKKRSRSISEISTPCDLVRLHEVLQELEIDQDEAIARIRAQYADPAKDLYVTIVMAAAEINKEIRDRTLNGEDPYTKSVMRLLEVGDKVVKSVRQAKLEAYPDTAPPKSEEGAIGDS